MQQKIQNYLSPRKQPRCNKMRNNSNIYLSSQELKIHPIETKNLNKPKINKTKISTLIIASKQSYTTVIMDWEKNMKTLFHYQIKNRSLPSCEIKQKKQTQHKALANNMNLYLHPKSKPKRIKNKKEKKRKQELTGILCRGTWDLK